MTQDRTIGFVGAGQMARALARGFVTAGLVQRENVLAADPSETALEQLQRDVPGARRLDCNASVVANSQTVFLAVKPQNMPTVFAELCEATPSPALFVSIAAGVPLARLCEGLGTERVVRVMPNTPCLVGRGASAYCVGPAVTAQDGCEVGALLKSVGVAFQVEEKLLDAVTGLSGSGPAFVYQVIEALSDGGVLMGLPRDFAQKLAAQTVCGAAEMVLATGEHPAVLKDRVASPGGTTIAGLNRLEQGGLRAALIAAVVSATERSRQLGQSS